MKVGILLIFQNYQGRYSDEQMVRDQIRIADLAEPLGFDSLWPPEHHFTDYSACPDNVQFLSYMAAKTSRIQLGTGAVIVPWNHPLRVVEKIAFLDHLSGGRAVLGLGRGLSRVEYEHFGIEMNSARDRFDEGSRMIIEGLEKGFIEGDGPFYPQIRTEIRPRPLRGFRDRFYCVGISPESVQQVAKLGARLMVFSQTPWEMFKDGALAAYRTAWGEHQEGPPPPPLTGDLMFCHADAVQAEAMAYEYMANYYLAILKHYELMSEHFKGTKGYEFYGNAGDALRAVGLENSAKIYTGIQAWGTPEQLIEKLRSRRAAARRLRALADLPLRRDARGSGRAEHPAVRERGAARAAPLVGWAKAETRTAMQRPIRRPLPTLTRHASRVAFAQSATPARATAAGGARTHCGLRGTSLAILGRKRAQSVRRAIERGNHREKERPADSLRTDASQRGAVCPDRPRGTGPAEEAHRDDHAPR